MKINVSIATNSKEITMLKNSDNNRFTRLPLFENINLKSLAINESIIPLHMFLRKFLEVVIFDLDRV